MSYLRNPLQFEKTYIKGIRIQEDSPASITGKAFHKCLELYYSRVPIDAAIQIGENIIRAAEATIKFGVMGSLQKSVDNYHVLVENYFGCPTAQFPLDSVHSVEAVRMVKTPNAILPLKAVSDMIILNDHVPGFVGRHYTIVDWKTTATLSKVSGVIDEWAKAAEVEASYWIQAAFNYWTCYYSEEFGLHPRNKYKERRHDKIESMLFVEVKRGKAMGEGAQVVNIVEIPFRNSEITAKYFSATRQLVRRIVKELKRHKQERVYLPNPADMYNGQDTWNDFVRGIDVTDYRSAPFEESEKGINKRTYDAYL
jgi:hypothetical protein